MIRLAADAQRLPPAERFALATLVDCSRLLQTADRDADVVELYVDDAAPNAAASPATLRDWAPAFRDGVVRIGRDVLAAVAAVVTADSEQRSRSRDRFDRVPSAENVLVQLDVERFPVVSGVANAIREAVARASGRRVVRLLSAWPDGRPWAAAITHDLDVVQWWPLFSTLRVVELIRSGSGRDALRAIGAAAASVFDDPVSHAVRQLLHLERDRGAPSTWFVLCGDPTLGTLMAGDLTYRIDHRRTEALLRDLGRPPNEIGLHGSFATFESGELLRAQRARLAHVTGGSIAGVRQHFLRMRPPQTQRAMVAAGFSYDATFGFPDRNGFRLGVADVVQGWDHERSAPLPLDLVPLVWMDRALSKYRGIQRAAAWIDDAIELAQTCRAHGGLWVGLWHPNLAPALGYPDAPNEYGRLLRWLTSDAMPYLGTLAELTEWRRQRRATLATRVAQDGRVELAGGGRVPLVDERGRVVDP